MAPVLGYWSIRGLAQPIRYMLHYLGVEYEEKQYDMQPGTSRAELQKEWSEVKETLGLELPNLPYYIDGDLKISESRAIVGRFARKHNLAGSCEKDYIRLDVAAGIMADILISIGTFAYDPQFESKKAAFYADVSPMIERLSKLVGKGNYILGRKISFQDFALFELLERCVDMYPDCLANFPNLVAFQARMAALPGVEEYRESPAFLKLKPRFNARIASSGAGTY